MRITFGPKRREVTRNCRQLNDEHFYYILSSQNIIGMIKSLSIRQTRLVVGLGKKGNACRSLEGKPESKEKLGRPKRRWKNNMKVDLKVMGWENLYWLNLS